MSAFKVAGKATTLSKLGKVPSMVDKALKYGDDALKVFATKLRDSNADNGRSGSCGWRKCQSFW